MCVMKVRYESVPRDGSLPLFSSGQAVLTCVCDRDFDTVCFCCWNTVRRTVEFAMPCAFQCEVA